MLEKIKEKWDQILLHIKEEHELTDVSFKNMAASHRTIRCQRKYSSDPGAGHPFSPDILRENMDFCFRLRSKN